ncbi:transcription factor HES-5-like [Aplochiton taeniatus]
MAPTYIRDFDISVLSPKDKHKIRKPVVEKMRRDRINSCIEQLKALLEKEFHKQDPNAKLEKADILEMTVLYLKQQLQPPSAQSEGFSQCWRDTQLFLSANSLKDVKLPSLHSFHAAQRAGQVLCPTSPVSSKPHSLQGPAKQPSSLLNNPVWRPW